MLPDDMALLMPMFNELVLFEDVFFPTPCFIFLDGLPNDQLLTIHWQIF